MTSALLTDDLFSNILLTPARNNTTDLYIVSGYASAVMASYHMEQLKKQRLNINIHLLIGMTSRDGLSLSNHQTFKSLVENQYHTNFTCSYLIDHPPVHSKVYTWLNSETPILAFTGSTNYSQQAFVINSQKEVASGCDANDAYAYYESLIGQSMYCTHQEVEEYVALYSNQNVVLSNRDIIEEENADYQVPSGLEKITVSLLQANGEIHTAGGLNWGQRQGREPNQAYIPLKADVWRSSFFPPIGQHFTVKTDDKKILVFTRAQQNGKALHTPLNNSSMGEYFRNRLGINNGEFVTKEDITNYGRTTVDFYKIDEEQYQMDFSVQ